MEHIDWHEYQREKREAVDPPSYPVVTYPRPVISRCFKCAWPIDISGYADKAWSFDKGTETVHVCRPTLNALTARRRAEALRDEYAENRKKWWVGMLKISR